MSRIVFFCIPAHGHTNPTLAVVEELVRRGNEVHYYSYEPFRREIEGRGAVFHPCDMYDRELDLTPDDGERLAKDIAFATEVLCDTTLAMGEHVERELADMEPDVIVGDSMAVWGKLMAGKLAIPFVSSTTTFAFNKESAKTMKKGLSGALGLLKSMPAVNRQLRRFRKAGYDIRNIMDIMVSDNDTYTVVYTSPEFQPASGTFSDRHLFAGPSVKEATSSFEKRREKLIYISMGTVLLNREDFYENCVEAFRDTPYQVHIAAGRGTVIRDLPENMTAEEFTDQMAVLHEADLFFTHCGMNSVSESLWEGVPVVTMPQTDEQTAVAVRTEEKGAGIRLASADPASIREAAERILSDPSYRRAAEEVGEGFRRCCGPEGAAAFIEKRCVR